MITLLPDAIYGQDKAVGRFIRAQLFISRVLHMEHFKIGLPRLIAFPVCIEGVPT